MVKPVIFLYWVGPVKKHPVERGKKEGVFKTLRAFIWFILDCIWNLRGKNRSVTIYRFNNQLWKRWEAMSCCLFDLVKRLLGRFQNQNFHFSHFRWRDWWEGNIELASKNRNQSCWEIHENSLLELLFFLVVQEKDNFFFRQSESELGSICSSCYVLWVVCPKKIFGCTKYFGESILKGYLWPILQSL